MDPAPVLHPGAPAPERLLDHVGPVWNAMRRPCAERGEGEAQCDDLARLIRSVGPTIVATVLLDARQLNSRWSALERWMTDLEGSTGPGSHTPVCG
jgi:hypothetical protein